MRCVAGLADRPRAAACRREWSRRHRLLGGDGSSLPLSTASDSVGGDSPGTWASRHASRSNPSARIAKASDVSRWIKLIQGAISRITLYPCAVKECSASSTRSIRKTRNAPVVSMLRSGFPGDVARVQEQSDQSASFHSRFALRTRSRASSSRIPAFASRSRIRPSCISGLFESRAIRSPIASIRAASRSSWALVARVPGDRGCLRRRAVALRRGRCDVRCPPDGGADVCASTVRGRCSRLHGVAHARRAPGS